MQLTAAEQSLTNALRELPAIETERILDWARQLADATAEED